MFKFHSSFLNSLKIVLHCLLVIVQLMVNADVNLIFVSGYVICFFFLELFQIFTYFSCFSFHFNLSVSILSVFLVFSEWHSLKLFKFEFLLKKKIRDILRYYSKIISLQFAFLLLYFWKNKSLTHLLFSISLKVLCSFCLSSLLFFFFLFFLA